MLEKLEKVGAGEMARQFIALATLLEGLSLIPNKLRGITTICNEIACLLWNAGKHADKVLTHTHIHRYRYM